MGYVLYCIFFTKPCALLGLKYSVDDFPLEELNEKQWWQFNSYQISALQFVEVEQIGEFIEKLVRT